MYLRQRNIDKSKQSNKILRTAQIVTKIVNTACPCSYWNEAKPVELIFLSSRFSLVKLLNTSLNEYSLFLSHVKLLFLMIESEQEGLC